MIKQPLVKPQIVPRLPWYKHQEEDLESTKDLKYFAFFWEMGLGKTKIIIETAAHLYLKGEIDGLIVVAPKGVYLNWPLLEIAKHMPTNVPYRCEYYSSYMSKRRREAANRVLVAKDDMLDIFVINVESLATVNGAWYAQTFARNHYTMVVVDESTVIKTYNSKRTKACLALATVCDYKRILTGTPITQNPLDLYSQLEFLERGASGFRSFTAFRSYYAVMEQVRLGNRVFDKIAGFRNTSILTDHIRKIGSRRTKLECLDLPDKIFETLLVEWSPTQERLYRELKESALATIDAGEVSVVNALELLMQLHRINRGHVRMENGEVADIEHNCMEALTDFIEVVDDKVIVWAWWQKDIEAVHAKLNEEYGPGSAVHYYGKTSPIDRQEAIYRFTKTPGCRFFVANPVTAGRGLTLVESATVVYYSLNYSLELWLQSQDRNHRIGQDRPVTYATIAIPDTVDTRLLKALQSKQDLAQLVLGDLRGMIA